MKLINDRKKLFINLKIDIIKFSANKQIISEITNSSNLRR